MNRHVTRGLVVLALSCLLSACGRGSGDECDVSDCDEACVAQGHARGVCAVDGCECIPAADGDADSDSDSDADGDGDADGDVDSDADVDGGADSDTDADADGEPCGDGLTRCGSECVDLVADPSHCGTCDEACPGVEHGSAVCVEGGCGIDCDTEYVSRDGACEPYSTHPYGTWRSIASAPVPFMSHFSVWTGDEMLVFPVDAGEWSYEELLAYDPAADSWRRIDTAGIPESRSGAVAVWTGSQLIVWGGWTREPVRYRDDGAVYDLASDTWTPMMMTAAPSGRIDATGVWAGDRLLVFGGTAGGTPLNDLHEYDLSTGIWRPLPAAGAPSGRCNASAVWTGDEALFWGGCACSSYAPERCLSGGGLYDPATETWRSTSAADEPAPRGEHAAAWTGRELLVWGGASFDGAWSYYADGGRYDVATDTWRVLPSVGAEARRAPSGVWTGLEFVPWGGWNGDLMGDVGCYRPDTDGWRVISVDGAPADRDEHAAVWTGREMLIAGGRNHGTGYYPRADGGAWTP